MSVPLYNSLKISLDNISGGLGSFIPELILSGTFILLIILDLIFGKRNWKIVPLAGIAGISIAFFYACGQFGEISPAENRNGDLLFLNMILLDRFGIFFKLVFSLAGILAILMALDYKPLRTGSKSTGELYALIVSAVLGMNLMAMSVNLLMMYISLELVSIASYILTVYTRKDYKSAEAGLKYVLYGGVSSASMIYGISFFYGYTGSLNITDPLFIEGIRQIPSFPLLFSLLLVLAGLGYKIAVAPFHFWSPDVYEGAPTPVTAFLAVGPKAAGFAMLIRFVTVFTDRTASGLIVWEKIDWVTILAIVSMLTMTLGNLSAIWQNNLKRMLAYSSIAHAGYVLMGVIAISEIGFTAVMFYVIIYLLMNLGAFLIVSIVSQETGSEDIRDWKGLGYKMPFTGSCMVLFMLALTGLPPTAGFTGKFYLFWGLFDAWQNTQNNSMFWLLVCASVNTVFALFYYFKVPIYMYLKKGNETSELKFSYLSYALTVLLAAPTLLLGLYFGWLLDFIRTNVL